MTRLSKDSKKLLITFYEQVLGDILNLHMELNKICDNKANFLLGISGVILMIALTKISLEFTLYNLMQLGFFIIMLASLISAILSVWVLKPKIGKGFERTNLFYYGSFTEKLSSREDYAREIQNLLKDQDKIIKHYAEEIWDFAYYDLAPRFRTINIATTILLVGLIIGTFFIIVSLLI